MVAARLLVVMPLRAVLAGVGLPWLVFGASVFGGVFNPASLWAIGMKVVVLVLLMCFVPTGVVLLVVAGACRLLLFV